MARPAVSGLSVAQLERLLNEKKSGIEKLNRKRAELQKKLDALDREIEKLGGSPGQRTAGGRARNAMSLTKTLEAILQGGQPMSVKDIVDAVQAKGYRSSSPAFRGIVNQTLIKERKMFSNPSRGMYQLKK